MCEQPDEYSDAVVHAPPRRAQNYYPAPTPTNPSSSTLSPPRTSSSIILPLEGEIFAVDRFGIDNPNFNPVIHSMNFTVQTIPDSSNWSSNRDPTPILDLPPSYETVMRDQPSSEQPKTEFPQVFNQ
ncbi:uncharacterized protein CDAR_318261 [Caerostris darwini]|uniref:Uncharacterized protein n=1 Tax=Caerostris darwini TaxID=1538125 RepID=A0AAV4T712_9ARAC|nr:uncharacterized protein CDAR_318261 [Caerostris darwini]